MPLLIVLISLTPFGCVPSNGLVLEGTHRVVLLLFWFQISVVQCEGWASGEVTDDRNPDGFNFFLNFKFFLVINLISVLQGIQIRLLPWPLAQMVSYWLQGVLMVL